MKKNNKKYLKIIFFNNIIFVAKDKIKGEIYMELFRNIFFNTDKVVENTNVKVTYAGKLFQNGGGVFFPANERHFGPTGGRTNGPADAIKKSAGAV